MLILKNRYKKILYVFFLFLGEVFANPVDPQVQFGDVNFNVENNSLIIKQLSDKAVINWKDFNISKDEITKFVQNSSSSAVLNKITGDNPSKIYGKLISNGEVFLINQNGILIGKDAVIDTKGFLASTLNLSNEEFLVENLLTFSSNLDGEIVNEGQIKTDQGNVFLIAKKITNKGNILSENANLLAGTEVVLIKDNENIKVRVKGSGEIESSGIIESTKTRLHAAGGDLCELAINHSGIIQANKIENINGKVVLSVEEGISSISGDIIAPSGDIHVLSDHISLEDNAHISSSGDSPGEILIGGDYQGNNPDIKNAKSVNITSDVIINADGIENSDGGKVILWSDELNDFNGTVTARGGKETGNGGFVEISSKGYLNYKGICDTSALNGTFGQLLLDPCDIVVSADASSPAITVTAPDSEYPTSGYAGATATLNVSDLTTALASSNVELKTSNGTAGSPGTITISSNISWSAKTTLKLNADTNIIINSDITNDFTDGTDWTALNAFNAASPAGEVHGIYITGAVSSVEGNITMTGYGGDTLQGIGISIGSGGEIASTGTVASANSPATITLNGTGGSSSDGYNYGVNIADTGVVTSVDGNISITGNGGGAGGYGYGIYITDADTTISSTGTTANAATITLEGNANPSGGGSDVGLFMENGCLITSAYGDISITGNGGGGGSANVGIRSFSGAIISSTGTGSNAATIEFIGTGSSTGLNNNHGIYLRDGDITSIDGNISFTGNAGGSGAGSHGITIESGITVSSTGTGVDAATITLTGTGVSDGLNNSLGSRVYLSEVTSVDGNISITGYGGGIGSSDMGVVIIGTVSSTNDGTITLNGTGSPNGTSSSNHGVSIDSSSTVTSANGDISIIGQGGTGNSNAGIYVADNGTVISSTGTAAITLTGTGASSANSGNDGVFFSDTTAYITGLFRSKGILNKLTKKFLI
jgi:trimeric autotransporter adhesin